MHPPKSLVQEAIENYLKEQLLAEGYAYFPNQLAFKKKQNKDFTFEIGFVGSRLNVAGQRVHFDLHFHIKSPTYKRWHKKHFPHQIHLGGGSIYTDHLTDFEEIKEVKSGHWYDFLESEPEAIMNEAWKNYHLYWKRYFEGNDSWEKIWPNTTKPRLKVDGSLLTENFEAARKIISEQKNRLEKLVNEMEAPGLEQEMEMEVWDSRLTYINKHNSQV